MKKAIPIYIILPSLLIVGCFIFALTANAAEGTPYQVINLEPGWSIISTPKVLSSHEFSTSTIAENFNIYLLDPGSVSGWQTMQEAGQTEFQPLFAYFINNKTGQAQTLKLKYNFNLSPAQRLFQRTLTTGWNAIGIASPDYAIKQGASSGDTNNPSRISNSIIGSISQVVDFTADQSDLDSVKIGDTWASRVASEVDSLRDFRELKGYAVFVTETTDDYQGSQNINDGFELSVGDNNPTTIIAGSQGSTLFTFQVRSLYDLSINSLVFSHSGTGDKANISDFKLYDVDSGGLLGSATSTDGDGNLAFSNLEIGIGSGEIKKMKLVGNASYTAVGGRTHKFTLESVALDDDVTITGLPISNTLTMNFSIGSLDVDVQATPIAANIQSGATGQEIASWRFTAGATENFAVHSITLTHVGSAGAADVRNIKLKVNGVQIGQTITSLDVQDKATFDLSSCLVGCDSLFPLIIDAGTSKTVYAYSDVASGIWTTTTIIFEITQHTDVIAYGANSSGLVTITTNNWSTYTKQTGNAMTISQGTLTVNIDAAYNPASQNYVKGTSNQLFSAFKFSAGSTEGIRVVELRLKLNHGSATDISNVTLWDGSTQIAGPASVIGSYVTFGSNTIGWDSTGLFDVAKSQNKTILVKADIPSGAAAEHTVDLDIQANTDVWADGLDSRYDIAQANISLTSGDANTHTIKAYGALALSLSAQSPPAQAYIKGSTAKEFLKINLTAGSGEDISVTSITIRCYNASDAACTSGTTTNAKLLKADGTQYGSTVSAPTASAAFSGNLTVPASETVTLTLVADIPSTAGVGTFYWKQNGSDDITSTGISSSADIPEDGTATGNTMTVDAGSITVAAAATPGDQTLIIGSTEVPLVGLVLTAGTAENVRVTYFKLWTSSSGEASTTDIGNIALYDGATRLTTKKNLTTGAAGTVFHNITFSASDFLNSSGIDLTNAQQKTITVKGDLLSTGSDGHKIAIGVSTTDDIVTVGLSSNSDITETLTKGPASASGVNYHYTKTANNIYEVTTVGAGTLTVANNAGKPTTAILAVGQEGTGLANVVLHKVDFTAAREDIDIKSISVSRTAGADADFDTLTLWDGTTQLGSAQNFVNGSSTFSFLAGSYWRLPKSVTKTLTVKANLNGVRTVDGYGASTGDAPVLTVDTIDPQGVSSGNDSIAVNSGSATDTTVVDLSGNVQYIRQSKPTLASASLPSTVLGSGEKVLYRWTVTADSKGAVGWEKVVFDMSGSVNYPYAGTNISHIVGCSGASINGCTTKIDGVYMSTGTDPGGVQLIATSSMKVYDLGANQQIPASSTATGWTVSQSSGIAKISFVPDSEQVVSAGETRTYELRGTILTSGTAGDVLQTKIADRATSLQAGTTFTTIAGDSNLYTFIWTDRSATNHSEATSDWTNDYKVAGIPTATLSLSR